MSESKTLQLNVSGEYSLKMPQKAAWLALNDPDILQRCIKGCTEVTKQDAQHFKASFKINLGIMKKTFSAELDVDDSKAPDSYTLSSVFNSVILGDVKGHAEVTLTPKADANEPDTILHYAADIEVEGWLAKMGVSVLDDAIKRYMHRFFDTFHEIAPEYEDKHKHDY